MKKEKMEKQRNDKERLEKWIKGKRMTKMTRTLITTSTVSIKSTIRLHTYKQKKRNNNDTAAEGRKHHELEKLVCTAVFPDRLKWVGEMSQFITSQGRRQQTFC